jgi:uncharacterized membrane protein YoaK (UPF0700 family)
MKTRNNKYAGWALGIYLLSIPELIIGAIIAGATHSVAGIAIMCLSIPSIIIAFTLSGKDSELNKDFDKEEADKEKWEEYKRLHDKYGGKP